MPDSLALDSDAFHTLLTDALRAGPGSPEWHQAVLKLRGAAQTAQADELKLLLEAREALESGKEYRSVRAGSGFTRKVFDEIEKENTSGNAKRGPSTGSTITFLAAVVGIGLVILAVYFALRPAGAKHDVDELAGITVFTHPVVNSVFKTGKLPAEWQTFGEPVAATSGGLIFKPTAVDDARGGIVLTTALSADSAYAINIDLRQNSSSSNESTTVFIRDTGISDSSSAGRELVFFVQNGVPQVLLPDGRNVTTPGMRLQPNQPVVLSIKIDKEVVIIEANQNRLYAGPHQLSPTQDRYVGIRFQTPGSVKADAASVQDVLVQKQ